MTWILQAITGEFTGQEIIIDRDMLVGRHQDSDVLLQSSEISRKHAAFLLKDRALWVQDLKSSNGTFVNDLRIDAETLLKEGDIVQFAGLKFSVLQPAQKIKTPTFVSGVELQRVVVAESSEKEELFEPVQQPSEAIAASETAQQVELTPAQKMNEQGMPDLTARDTSIQVTKEGMPTNVGVPKPAPIPKGVDVSVPVKHEACDVEIPTVCVEQEQEAQKNASVGLMAVIAIVILAIIAFVMFK